MFSIFKSEEQKKKEEEFRIKGAKEFQEFLDEVKKLEPYLYNSKYVVKVDNIIIDSYRSGKSIYTHKESRIRCRIIELCHRGEVMKHLFEFSNKQSYIQYIRDNIKIYKLEEIIWQI